MNFAAAFATAFHVSLLFILLYLVFGLRCWFARVYCNWKLFSLDYCAAFAAVFLCARDRCSLLCVCMCVARYTLIIGSWGGLFILTLFLFTTWRDLQNEWDNTPEDQRYAEEGKIFFKKKAPKFHRLGAMLERFIGIFIFAPEVASKNAKNKWRITGK
jgi:hypothetical protein